MNIARADEKKNGGLRIGKKCKIDVGEICVLHLSFFCLILGGAPLLLLLFFELSAVWLCVRGGCLMRVCVRVCRGRALQPFR